MTSKRLSIECIKKFNPSKIEPLIVECDNGYYKYDYATIRIVGWNEKEVFIHKLDGSIGVWLHEPLTHYPSPYQPVRKYRVLFYKKYYEKVLITTDYYTDKEEFKKRSVNGCVFIQMIEEDFKDE